MSTAATWDRLQIWVGAPVEQLFWGARAHKRVREVGREGASPLASMPATADFLNSWRGGRGGGVRGSQALSDFGCAVYMFGGDINCLAGIMYLIWAVYQIKSGG